MLTKRIGLYPGTFDPITYGHMDIIEKALRICDHLIIAVAKSTLKKPFFSHTERIYFIEETLKAYTNIEICGFQTLLVDFAKRKKAHMIIRGLRNQQDLEYELSLASMNAQLESSIPAVFLTASEKYCRVSSRLVKEIHHFKGDISLFVPPCVVLGFTQKH